MNLSPELLEAYQKARYEVHLGPNVVSLSCEKDPQGDHSLFFGQPVAVITAFNPSAGRDRPRILSREENMAAHRSLVGYLEGRGLEFYPAKNSAADGSFEETAVAVFGLSREKAAAIGRSFGQAAVFYFHPAPPARSLGEILPCGDDLYSLIRRLPLVELHIHAEGAIPAAHILHLIQAKGGEDADRIRSQEDLSAFLTYRNFYEFIQKWIWTLSLIQTEAAYSDLVFEVMRSLKAQGAVHAELHFSPFDFVDGRLRAPGIVEAAVDGMRRARSELGMSGCLIADLVRNHPVETARARLESIAPMLGAELVGLGLGGNEAKFPPELFVDAFAFARSLGFRTVAHAGETAGADSVRRAVFELKAERIGHGLRAVDDSELVKILADRGTPLEVCLTSNEATGVLDSLADHPLRRMMSAGLNVSLHSDDPTMFHTSLLNEFGLFVSEFSGTADEIRAVAGNAIRSSFMDESMKKQFLNRVFS